MSVPAHMYFFEVEKELNLTEHHFSLTPKWIMPVTDLAERKRNVQANGYQGSVLSVCTGLLFRTQNLMLLLQFFEFFILQGVDKFFIHVSGVLPDKTVKILRYYQKRDVIHILHNQNREETFNDP